MMNGVFWCRDTIISADIAYFFDTTPPRFDISSTEKRGCNIRIARIGTMFFKKGLSRPIFWKLTIVANIEFIGINAYLNGHTYCKILMNKCIKQRFSNGIFWKRIMLNTCNIVVRYFGNQIFGIKKVYYPF